MPNASVPGVGYNYELTRPNESILSWQPAIRLDYQAVAEPARHGQVLGLAAAHATSSTARSPASTTRRCSPVVAHAGRSPANYNIKPTTFLEATYGRSQNELAGCALAQANTGPTFCTSASR